MEWLKKNGETSVHKPERWKNLQAIGMLESERYERGEITIERRYYIVTYYDAALFAKAARSHWRTEKKVHWTLDVTFREDGSRFRRGNGAHNLGVIRHVALNLLKHETTKRLRSAFDDPFVNIRPPHYKGKK